MPHWIGAHFDGGSPSGGKGRFLPKVDFRKDSEIEEFKGVYFWLE